jgi:hypothetical protein
VLGGRELEAHAIDEDLTVTDVFTAVTVTVRLVSGYILIVV